MHPILFDTSVYIYALRGGRDALTGFQRLGRNTTLWLSSVVLEELFAGASPQGQDELERLGADFGKARRILVPNLEDWSRTGKVLARLASRHGYEQIGRGRLTNDALIAMSAARLGVAVITANARDFARLAEFVSFTWSIL